MKKHTNIITALTLLAATFTSVVSCQMQEPDNPYSGKDTGIVCDLAPADTVAFAGDVLEFPFRVLSSDGPILVAMVTSEGAEASVTFSEQTRAGVLCIAPSEMGSVTNLKLNNGLSAINIRIRADIYYLRVEGFPEETYDSFGDGSGYSFGFKVETNLPEDLLCIEYDSWIGLELAGGDATVTLPENLTGRYRTGTVTFRDRDGKLEPVTKTIVQNDVFYIREGFVPFRERAFRNAMLYADTDGDGWISLEEAEDVQEILIAGSGVTDLSGLECFKNAWKVDARDNDIENADVLSTLRQLHWLDLRGNAHLKSFDLTGCCIYFRECRFDVNEGLRYRYLFHQHNITPENDEYALYGDAVIDTRTTRDWTRDKELILVHKGTKSDGKKAVCLSGLGYLDVDVEDGSFMRLMKDFAKAYFEKTELDIYLDHLDVYVYYNLFDKRDKYVFPACDWKEDYATELMSAYKKCFHKLEKETYDAVFPDEDGLLFLLTYDLHPDVLVHAGKSCVESELKPNQVLIYSNFRPSSALTVDELHTFGCKDFNIRNCMEYCLVERHKDIIYQFFGF